MKIAEIEKIYSSMVKLMLPLNQKGTYKTILDEAKNLAKADYGSIFLPSKDGSLEKVFTTFPKEYRANPRKDGFTYQVFNTRKALIISDDKLTFIHKKLRLLGIKSMIFIPLAYQNNSYGTLNLSSTKSNRFTKGTVHLLEIFGSLVSLKIRNNELYIESKKALKARDLFISLASHEFKTPLTTMSVYTQLLKTRQQKGQQIDPNWIKLLHSETVWLNILFNELLQVDHIKRGTFHFDWKKNLVNEILDRAIIHFKAQFPHHSIKVGNTLNENLLWYSDFDKILQIFTNLLNNAGKFSNPGSTIYFKALEKKGMLIFQIADSGKGIQEKDLKNIFKDFYKGPDHAVKGMGLGLYIVQKLIETHKGTIDIFSKPLVGTTVTLKFPLLDNSTINDESWIVQ